MKKLISILVAAMFAAVTLNAFAADKMDKMDKDPAKKAAMAKDKGDKDKGKGDKGKGDKGKGDKDKGKGK